jgi:hypothetical protein
MPNYTYEASRVSKFSHGGDQTPVTLSTKSGHGPNPFRGDCDEHGVHTALELDEQIVIESKEDDIWRLPEKYNVSYCEECVGEFQNETRLLEADSLEEAVAEDGSDVRSLVIAVIERNWRYLRNAFKPSDPSNLESIPVGGEEA